MGRALGAPGDPLLVSRALRRGRLDARDDGDRPQRRPQRRVGAGPGGGQRQPAVRARLLPAPAAHVRRHGAGHRGRAVPRRARRPQEGPRHHPGHRPRRRGPRRSWSRRTRRSSRRRPAGRSPRSRASSSTSPSAPSSTRGTPTARCSTAARSRSPRTSARPSTSRRWCSATSAPTPAPGVCFTRDPASGDQGVYGDYLQNAQGEDVVAGIRNTVSLADMERDRQEVPRRAAGDHVHARAALQGHVRHRVHRRARQALDAADPRRQADARRRRSGSRCTWPTRASSTWTRRCAG